MSISLNNSVFLFIFIFLLGTFTFTVYIIKASIEKQPVYKVSSIFIFMLLLYSCFEFLLFYFASLPNTNWVFHICVALSDIAYLLVVIFWLFLLVILSGNPYLVKKKLIIAITSIYGIVVEFMVFKELIEKDYFKPNLEGNNLTVNTLHYITLLNFTFSIFLIFYGLRCLSFGIFKMYGKKTRRTMVALSSVFIVYLVWITYWDYSITVLSKENILKFDPILIVFLIVCLILLGVFLKKGNLLAGKSGVIYMDLVNNEGILWEIITKKYKLTQRETEIVQLVYEGQSNPSIAQNLFIAEDTVKKHLNHIFRKTETKSRYELMNCITKEVKFRL